MAFTPGPFEDCFEGRTIIVCDAATHADLAEFFHAEEHIVSTSREEAEANARLFMASPDLLAACEALDRSWSEAFPEGPDWKDPKGNLSISGEHVRIWKQIRAAIKRAEGGQS